MLKIMGKPQASIEQMRTYIKEVNPQVPDSVVKMIPLYIAEGTAEGVRGVSGAAADRGGDACFVDPPQGV